MKVLGRILVLLAGALLMFHSLVPHQHHTELNPKEHIVQHNSAESLFDFIKLALHLDQGEDHLEHYNVADGLQFNLDAVPSDLLHFAFSPTTEKSIKVGFSTASDALPKREFISYIRFRGPPA